MSILFCTGGCVLSIPHLFSLLVQKISINHKKMRLGLGFWGILFFFFLFSLVKIKGVKSKEVARLLHSLITGSHYSLLSQVCKGLELHGFLFL